MKVTPRTMIIVVLVISIALIGGFLFVNRQTDLDKMNMAYDEVFDNEILKANIKTTFKQTYELSDYTIYGETLVLYENAYAYDTVDALLGKSVVLRNVISDEECIFTFNGGIDSGIDLGTLDEGMYEIYVYDHYKKKRVYFSDEFQSEQFTTLRRDGKTKTITLNAQRDYLDAVDIDMDTNYAFLTVIENTAVASIYDVAIDPSGYVVDVTTGEVDYGYSNGEFKESDASYQLALLLKEYLEDEGLRVIITRDENEAKGYYGQSGRASMAYESGAKICISLGVTTNDAQDEEVSHPYLITSPYTNATFANEVAYYLKQNSVILNTMSDDEQLQDGVAFDSYHQEYDANLGYYVDTPYELFPQIRELGGKCTFAGTLDTSQENRMYTDHYGIYSLYLTYCNVDSTDSITYYNAISDMLARKMAGGICQFFQINDNN